MTILTKSTSFTVMKINTVITIFTLFTVATYLTELNVFTIPVSEALDEVHFSWRSQSKTLVVFSRLRFRSTIGLHFLYQKKGKHKHLS